MKKAGLLVATFCILLIVIIQSCKKNDFILVENKLVLPQETPSYVGFNNNDLVQLGRVLFYDRALSINNKVSCGSCHKQEAAFANNLKIDIGFTNQPGTRNTPAIVNSRNKINFFWDSRTQFISNVVLQPVSNHIEMGFYNINDLQKRISSISYYPELFAKAFGSTEITNEKIGNALSNFVSSISSTNTPFDVENRRHVTNEPKLMSDLQKHGMELFKSTYNCQSCHNPGGETGYQGGNFPVDVGMVDPFVPSHLEIPLDNFNLTTSSSEIEISLANIGLDETVTDLGFGGITNEAKNNGKMKIPDLRNVTHTAPYMHDGRFNTLSEVLDHYSHGIKNNENLDPRLKDASGNAKKFNISESDKMALIDFMESLSNIEELKDSKFSDPFVY